GRSEQAGDASADGFGPAVARCRLWQCDPVDLWSNDIPLSLRGEVLSCQQSLSSALSGSTKVMVRPPISSAPASITWSNPMAGTTPEDRKSTRLNSSHVSISYAVFCLKKKIARQR